MNQHQIELVQADIQDRLEIGRDVDIKYLHRANGAINSALNLLQASQRENERLREKMEEPWTCPECDYGMDRWSEWQLEQAAIKEAE